MQMKVPVLGSLILLLGLSTHLPAIERPKTLDGDELRERPANREAEQVREPEAIPQVARQDSAWLGVASEAADETLSIHLGIECGVILRFIVPGSPAAKSGLMKHDVVTKVNGRAIANQIELREEIQSHGPGDEVTLSMVNKGQAVERKVVLGERPAAAPALPGRDDVQAVPKLPGLGELGKRFPDLAGRMKDLEGLVPGGEDLQKKLDGHMKRLENQLREMEKGGGGLKLDFNLFDKLPNAEKGGFNFNFKASSSFKFFDNDGSVEMKMKDGGKEVVVRDKGGEVLFEGPWDTDQDKAAAPEEIRERVEKMNDGDRFHFRLEDLPEPHLEFPEEKKPDLE